MVPNFNINYVSSMFLDIACYETTTTKYRDKNGTLWGQTKSLKCHKNKKEIIFFLRSLQKDNMLKMASHHVITNTEH